MKTGRFLWQLVTPVQGQNRARQAAIALQAACCAVASVLCLGAGLALADGLALASQPDAATRSRATATCSPQDLSLLVTQLMLDLPSYSNRVIQRASDLGDTTPLYFIVAGRAEIRPIALKDLAEQPNRSRLPLEETSSPQTEEIYQIRFTTLERQYGLSASSSASSASAIVEQTVQQPVQQVLKQAAPSLQQFHQLVLARQQRQASPSEVSPWRILSLRSQQVIDPHGEAPILAPAQASRQGAVGQGIALWLRDWHSGVIRTSAANSEPGPNPGPTAHPPDSVSCVTH